MQQRRAAIYARYSTDLQNERSVDDQIALCRDYAARNDLSIAGAYSDSARSGASILGRDGLIALLAQARTVPRPFEVVLVEHSDRLSRSMKDLADIHETMTFAGITIQTVHSGEMNTAMIGLFGLVGQMQPEDGAKKVRRGMTGVVRDGRSAGGRAYATGRSSAVPASLLSIRMRRPSSCASSPITHQASRLAISPAVSTARASRRHAARAGMHRRSTGT